MQHAVPSKRLGAIAAGALVVLTLAAGCGSDQGGEERQPRAEGVSGDVVDVSGTEPVGETLAGSVAPLVECRDWNGATDAEKQATVADVRSQQRREEGGISEPRLTDDEATELFDSACRPKHAQGFRLYKLYAQAAGFVALKRALDE